MWMFPLIQENSTRQGDVTELLQATHHKVFYEIHTRVSSNCVVLLVGTKGAANFTIHLSRIIDVTHVVTLLHGFTGTERRCRFH